MNSPTCSTKALTARQVAERIGLTPYTVRRYVSRGLLPGFVLNGKGVRVMEADLVAFLEDAKQQGGRS